MSVWAAFVLALGIVIGALVIDNGLTNIANSLPKIRSGK